MSSQHPIADLSMYDWPETRAANDAFWQAVARRLNTAGIPAPTSLTRRRDHAVSWTDPMLLLGQTCGLPYVSGQCADAVIVARPDYGLPFAAGGCYQSVVLVREADVGIPLTVLRGTRVAVNEWRSFSGHIALRAQLAGIVQAQEGPFFGSARLSGSHRESARMVAAGEADVAALDGVAWALLQIADPEVASRLAVIDKTAPAPALPFITSACNAGLRDLLAQALAGATATFPPAAGVPRAVIPATDADYDATRAAARRAADEPFAPEAPAVPPV